MRTTFHEYKRPDGTVITVEYGYAGGSPKSVRPYQTLKQPD